MGFPGGFYPRLNGNVFRKCIPALLLALMQLIRAKPAWSIAMGSKGLISPEVWGLFLLKYILELEQGLAFAFSALSAAGSKASHRPGLRKEAGPGLCRSSAAAHPPPLPPLCCRQQASVSQIRCVCPEQAALAFLT